MQSQTGSFEIRFIHFNRYGLTEIVDDRVYFPNLENYTDWAGLPDNMNIQKGKSAQRFFMP